MTAPPSSTSGQRLPRNVKLLGTASLLNDVASEMIFPLLPHFLLTVLHGNKFHLGVIEGVADSASSVLKLASGGWSDRARRRKGLVVFGYGLASLVRPLIGLATAPWHVFVARTADRVGKGVRTSPRDAMIADSTSAEIRGRAFGFHRAMDHLGAAIGPLLAMLFLWLWPGGFRELFLLAIVPGVIVVLLLAFGLKEAPRASPPKERTPWTLKPFGRDFRLYLGAVVVFTLGNSSDIFLLTRAGELGVSPVFVPLLWSVHHICKSGGNWLAGLAVDKLGPRPLVFAGWMVYAGIYLGFALATAAWQVWLLFILYAIFYALTEPAERTLVASLVGSEHRGLAFGWFHFAVGIATLPASLIFGGIYEVFGPLAAFGWSGSLALAAAVLLAAVRTDGRNAGT